MGQSRRFCDVSFSVRSPHRTLSRPIGTGLPGSFLRPNCLRPAQPRQLRRSVLDRLREMSCICGRQRPGISTAPNPRGTCSRSACPGFCPMAVWRRIAQDRRGADHRPLDSRIKGARCAAVGRQPVQKLIAIFLASPHIAKDQVLLCAQEVSAMCGRGRSDLALLSDRRLEWRCRTSRGPSRLAPCAPGSAG
jgi:hypothetical protein